MRLLTFFHTAEPNIALFDGLMKEVAPEIPLRHVLEPEPLARAMAAGKVTREVALFTEERVLAALAEQPAMLVCTCSTIGGVIDQMADLHVPLLRIDRPMAEKAVGAGSRVLIAACVESTVEPTRELVDEAGWRRHRQFSSQVIRIFDAWPLFQAGDRAGYHARIAERIREASAGFDAVVLAQASMAGAADLLRDLGIPVFSSPRVGAEAMADFWRRWTARKRDWIDALVDVLESIPAEDKDARSVVRMAICLGEQLERPTEEPGPRRVRFEFEEYDKLPGSWELMDGLLSDRQGWPRA